MVYTSDSLNNILSHLSTRTMSVIVDENGARRLARLLEFLAAWEKRPVCLAPIAYKWCSAISEVAGPVPQNQSLLRIQDQDIHHDSLLEHLEQEFSSAGPGLDPFRMSEYSQVPTNFHPGLLIFITLEVGFRPIMPNHDQPTLHLDHTPHHDSMFKRTFSIDDEVIADGVCAWIADRDHMPAGSCVHYLAERVAKDKPFSPRLRQMNIHLIERMWDNKLGVSELETVRLLNHLDFGVDDMEDKEKWVLLLVDVMRSPAGLGGLSIHYWHLLLEILPLTRSSRMKLSSSAVELVRLLEDAEEDWEKLEVWLVIGWQRVKHSWEHVKQVTLKHLLRRSSALPRFEGLAESGKLQPYHRVALQRVCTRARAEQSYMSSEPLLL